MFNRTAAMLAATILAGTTTMATAESQQFNTTTSQPGVNASAQIDRAQAERGESRFERRAALRRQLRQEGFQNIRISDAMFAVQARTPDGRQVLMVANPTDESSRRTEERVSRTAPSITDQQRQRGTAAARQAEEPSSSRDVASAKSGLDEVRAVPVRLPDGRTVLVFVTPADEATSAQASASTQRDQATASRQESAQDRSDRRRQVARSDQDASTSDTRPGASAVESAVREQYTGAISSDLMSPERARSRLESEGFSNVGNWQKEGDTYTGTADWHGEEVDFRFDAREGQIVEPNELGRGQVENILSDAGFSNVTGVQQLGNTFRANAEQDGMRYLVRVDAETGEILNRRPYREG